MTNDPLTRSLYQLPELWLVSNNQQAAFEGFQKSSKSGISNVPVVAQFPVVERHPLAGRKIGESDNIYIYIRYPSAWDRHTQIILYIYNIYN